MHHALRRGLQLLRGSQGVRPEDTGRGLKLVLKLTHPLRPPSCNSAAVMPRKGSGHVQRLQQAMAMPKACIMLFGGACSSCEDHGLKNFADQVDCEVGNSGIYFVGPRDLQQRNWTLSTSPSRRTSPGTWPRAGPRSGPSTRPRTIPTQWWTAPGSGPPLSGRSWSCRDPTRATVLPPC